MTRSVPTDPEKDLVSVRNAAGRGRRCAAGHRSRTCRKQPSTVTPSAAFRWCRTRRWRIRRVRPLPLPCRSRRRRKKNLGRRSVGNRWFFLWSKSASAPSGVVFWCRCSEEPTKECPGFRFFREFNTGRARQPVGSAKVAFGGDHNAYFARCGQERDGCRSPSRRDVSEIAWIGG